MNYQNIRIVSIAPYRFQPAVNGGQKAIEQLYGHIAEYAETIVVSTKSNNETLTQNYRLIKLFSNHPLHYINVFYFFKIKSLIKKHNITHVMMEHPYMGWLGFLLKKYAGVKWIIRSQNIESVRFKTFGKKWWKLMWLYERWVHSKANASFFITDEDKHFAIENYHLSPQKCHVATYGINQQTAPSQSERINAKTTICNQYNIPISNTTLLFNGDLGYFPNTLAVEAIVTKINPLLLQHSSVPYTIFICGKNLPEQVQKQIVNESTNIIYTGFVNDVVPYFLAADVFINPVVAGGGIKTKLVEALGYNCNAVSTSSGAAGVMDTLTNNKLQIVQDYDWKAFAYAVLSSNISAEIPTDFYDYFYWGNIARKAVNTLVSL